MIVVERNRADVLDETSFGVHGLLTCLENMFYSALRDDFKFRKDWKLWRWIAHSCENMPQSCVGLVNSLDNLQNGLAKVFKNLLRNLAYLDLFVHRLFIFTVFRCYYDRSQLRAFLRLALQSKRLHVYLDVLFNSAEFISFDMRADELNSPCIGQIDYAFLLNSTNNALLHEEYTQQLRRLGFDDKLFPTCLVSRCHDISRPLHRWQSPVDWSAIEATEDLNVMFAAETHPQASPPFSPSSLFPFSQKGRRLMTPTPQFADGGSCVPGPKCTDMTAIEATEDVDVVDLLYESGVAGGTSLGMRPLLRVEFPRSQSYQFAIGEQETSKCCEVYRLPNANDADLPSGDVSPLDFSRLFVTVRPSNTNYRARFSVPKTVVGGSLRQLPPQLDLLSELQQTDSSFPLTGLSLLASGDGGGGGDETEGACSTSDQVSDIVNEVASEEETAFGSSASGGECAGCPTTTSSSRNTVLTSTSTIRPTNSLGSSPSIHEAITEQMLYARALVDSAVELPREAFRRSTSDLPATTTTSMIVEGSADRPSRHVVSPPCFTSASPVPKLNS
ncbi:unnamed protein product [Hydatigera taeniaeformis]|uniref:RUN domain-containing protein n=1 Tax=Hydatigena taeniaeformis TaxID=6205 RepID=A0A0R3X463_HYDTA|nr:unnamed protein product [Hydatigera taeniaeformis]